MANTPQAQKRVRQNQKRRTQNAGMRSKMRTEVKKTRMVIHTDPSRAQDQLSSVSRILDSYARKGLISKNKAARLKSRLSARAKAASAA